MEIQRKLAQQPDALQDWFNRLHKVLQQHGISSDDIYNMDETGCRIGVAKSQYIYTARKKQQVVIPSANNRELVTLVEYISASGISIPPLVIVAAKSLIEHWIVDLPDDYLVICTDSGYSNDETALH
jgi:hypothetical protein